MAITDFRGEYRWLSNFWEESLTYNGISYRSAEHAYQAAKATTREDLEYVKSSLTPRIAKSRGNKIKIRTDWEDVKVKIMYGVLREKFKNKSLLDNLLGTEDHFLVEGNTWGDKFWGVCNGRGLNWLGRLLMDIREEVKNG